MQTLNLSRNLNNNSPLKAARRLQRLALASLFVTVGCAAVPAFALIPPSTPNLDDASDSGLSNTDNITNVAQPVFYGTGSPLATITLFNGTRQIGATIVLPSGRWSLITSVKLNEGNNAITVQQDRTSVLSNSAVLNVTLDTQGVITSVPDLAPGSDTGNGNGDNCTCITTPLFTGGATAGATIYLYNTSVSNTAVIGTGKTNSQGVWTAKVTTPLPGGTHDYKIAARASDTAGNISPMSAPLNVNIDTDAPAQIDDSPDLIASDDSGVSNADNWTNVTTPTITLKCEPNAKISFFDRDLGDALLGTSYGDNNGVASLKLTKPLAERAHVIYASVYDRAGNGMEGEVHHYTTALDLNIDTIFPVTPSRPNLNSISDSGVQNDGITRFPKPSITGFFPSLGLGADLTIKVTGGVVPLVYKKRVSNSETSWNLTLDSLPTGVYTVTATNTDPAGNASVSEPMTLTVDLNLPLVAITSPKVNAPLTSLASVTGTTSDYSTSVKTVEIALLRTGDNKYWNGLAWSGVPSSLATTLSNGTWSSAAPLPNGADFPGGTYIVSVMATDIAGNQSIVANTTFGNVAPSLVSVTPGMGASLSGVARNLVSVYSDANGAADIIEARLFVSSASSPANMSPANGLMGRYFGGKFYLRTDDGSGYIGGFGAGTAHIITNSQGSLDCSKSTVALSGNTLTITWNFIPKTSFGGTKSLYTLVIDAAKAQEGWISAGTWTIVPLNSIQASGGT